ncbi:MAG: site-specific DNA-methyltransferase [Candidatus Scalindua sp.]|nr:site-specific DNA-methyltransferase [Candidatus Scalindua sp.]
MKNFKPLKELLDSVRDIEGFPIGKDEDILELSDPPYYTACPNPYINDFIKEYGKKYNEYEDDFNITPFIDDIVEGKGDVIYNLHTYHTKVPPKVILRKILHYTKPGDIVFDGFCGTGMTGVAAALCENNEYVQSAIGNLKNMGKRFCILSDISPIATFISWNYNKKHNITLFEQRSNAILNELDSECEWMFKTIHSNSKNKTINNTEFGRINYTVWSDVYLCPYCKEENIFWHIGVDEKLKRNKDIIFCQECKADITNTTLKRKYNDNGYAVLVPVLLNYTFQGAVYTKKPEQYDLEIISKCNNLEIPYWFPTNILPDGSNTAQPRKSHGLKTIDSFYTKRNLYVTSCLFYKIKKSDKEIQPLLLFWLQSVMLGQTKMNRYFEASYSQVNRYLKGTLYVGKKISEVNYRYSLTNKIKKISKYLGYAKNTTIINTGSSTNLPIIENSVDYIFVDPPFGGNIMYSELNYIWESWLKVLTNNSNEAIVNKVQLKDEIHYRKVIEQSFCEFYRILKPNRWITIEFHNSKSEIWNILQNSISKAGFIIASVSLLDKKQKTFKQMTAPGSVDSDLIITAYKPRQKFEQIFLDMTGEGLEDEFIKMHLSHISPEPSIERTEQMLYSKMLSFYVQRSYTVKYDASTFYKMLRKNFADEDDYWFNPDQIETYREYKKKMKLEGIGDIRRGQMNMFVSDEKSALIWLNSYIDEPSVTSIIKCRVKFR